MKPEIEMYFQDPAEFAMKFIRQFSQVFKNYMLINYHECANYIGLP